MKIAVIGHNSFLARALADLADPAVWAFYGHDDYDGALSADCVINCAYHPALRQGPYEDAFCMDTQIVRRITGHYVMISSRAVYGADKQAVRRETDIPAPQGFYAENKLIAEQSVRRILGPDRCTILRASNIFGPERGRRTFTGMALDRLHSEGRIVLDMAADVQRDFIPVEHAAALIAHVASRPVAGGYNLGSGMGTACGAFVQALIDGYGQGALECAARHHDGFVLDMAHFYNTWPDAPRIQAADIIRAAQEAGRCSKA